MTRPWPHGCRGEVDLALPHEPLPDVWRVRGERPSLPRLFEPIARVGASARFVNN